jgi:hypothetical protein
VELPVECPLRIGNHGKGYVEFQQKLRAFLRGSHSHQNHPRTGLLELCFSGAQLRHLLAAERSAEMSQEHEDQPITAPKLAQLR